jgi:hypothetical protein
LRTLHPFCGGAAVLFAGLVLFCRTSRIFLDVLAIENDAGYICRGLPYERRLEETI